MIREMQRTEVNTSLWKNIIWSGSLLDNWKKWHRRKLQEEQPGLTNLPENPIKLTNRFKPKNKLTHCVLSSTLWCGFAGSGVENALRKASSWLIIQSSSILLFHFQSSTITTSNYTRSRTHFNLHVYCRLTTRGERLESLTRRTVT